MAGHWLITRRKNSRETIGDAKTRWRYYRRWSSTCPVLPIHLRERPQLRKNFFHKVGLFCTSSRRSNRAISSIARLYSREALSTSVAASCSIARSIVSRIVELPSPREIRFCSAFPFSFFTAISSLTLNSSSFSLNICRFSLNRSASRVATSWRLISASTSPTSLRKPPVAEITVDISKGASKCSRVL